MPAFLSIALLTLRSILRERVALSMLVLLAGVWILLPAGLEGDGTVEGELRMLVRYIPGFTAVLLAVMTVWISCASIAGDLSNKRLHMVLAKPVSRAQIWWGKWLAVITLITVLLFIGAGATLWRVQVLLQEIDLTEDERAHLRETLVTAREPVPPTEEDFTPTARERLREQRASGWEPPPQFNEEELLRRMTQNLRTLRYSVQGGQEAEWEFPLRAPVRPGERLQLELRYQGGSMGLTSIEGEWVLGTPDAPALATLPLNDSPHGSTVRVFNRDDAFAGATRILARFHYRGEESDAVFFTPDNGVRIYRPGGAFTPNLLRATLLLAGLLSLLAALGVGAGAVFSLPVACYATAVILLLPAFSGVVERVVLESEVAEEASGIQRAAHSARGAVFRALLVALRPLDLDRPLERVSRGIDVDGGEVFRVIGLRFTPLLLAFAAVGIGLFHRREVGGAT